MGKMALALGSLFIVLAGCGGGGGDNGSSGSPPDMTGNWIGIFTSTDGGYTQTIYVAITVQNNDTFSGIWESDILSSKGQVEGFVYPSDDSRWIADLEMTQGDIVTCCVPLLGCYEWPSRMITMFGYYENINGQKTIVDETASYNYGCLVRDGTMTLTWQ